MGRSRPGERLRLGRRLRQTISGAGEYLERYQLSRPTHRSAALLGRLASTFRHRGVDSAGGARTLAGC